MAGGRLLQLCLLAVSAWSSLSQSLSIADKPQRVVCTANYPPLSTCSSSTEPAGYEVELFKRTVERLRRSGRAEWNPGNWTWKCWDSWNSGIEDLKMPPDQRTCDVYVAGVTATAERKSQGIQFSYPTLTSGKSILIHVDEKRSIWFFLEPFDTALWVACFATSAVVGLLFLLAESRLRSLWLFPRPALQRAAGLQWGALATLLRMSDQLSPRTTGGRLILAGYGFLVLIMANVYIGSMTALLARKTNVDDLDSMEDLAWLPVGLIETDKQAFQRFALEDPHYFPWSTQDDEKRILDALRSNEVRALVLDTPWVKYMAAAYCDLYTVGAVVLPMNMGFAFPSDTPLSYLSLFDSSLTAIDDSGEMARLASVLLKPAQDCHRGTIYSEQFEGHLIRLRHVAGLWIILGCCVAACVFWNLGRLLFSTLYQRCLKQRMAGYGDVNGRKQSVMPGSSLMGAMQPADMLGAPLTEQQTMEALQRQLSEVDVLIRHMPFVIAATLDTRLAELKAQLLNPTHVPTPAGHLKGTSVPPHLHTTNGSTHSMSTCKGGDVHLPVAQPSPGTAAQHTAQALLASLHSAQQSLQGTAHLQGGRAGSEAATGTPEDGTGPDASGGAPSGVWQRSLTNLQGGGGSQARASHEISRAASQVDEHRPPNASKSREPLS